MKITEKRNKGDRSGNGTVTGTKGHGEENRREKQWEVKRERREDIYGGNVIAGASIQGQVLDRCVYRCRCVR